ncbi:type IV toxin-antitoxin system AbiEi family antitoxin [Actinomadura sp. 9N215]|uniref:type IV toxin-antitoxin system AbiEi family antitoxin domain-containing protein n=1 Tax=Actinomadura sp. 9N215 TaxID=3375150 RepID=UPI0037A8AEB1
MAETTVGVPPKLARRRNAVLRPRDAADVYAHPRPELARLARRGALRSLASGYYMVVPQRRLGDVRWRPDLHSAALGVAIADYGMDDVALMGTSAARHHGALPRAVAVAVVAIPRQRPALQVDIGQIVFVRRRVDRLDVERFETELAVGWVTTVEQTLLDVAARPTLGGLTEQSAAEAIRALAVRADWERVAELARGQRKRRAYDTARELSGRGQHA